MSKTSRILVALLGASLSLATALFAWTLWDEGQRLDREWSKLTAKAEKLRSGPAPTTASDPALRLRVPPNMPTAADFAAQVKDALRAAGLPAQDFSVREVPGKSVNMSIKTEGRMSQWVEFQTRLDKAAGPVIFPVFRFERTGNHYLMLGEVGYAARP